MNKKLIKRPNKKTPKSRSVDPVGQEPIMASISCAFHVVTFAIYSYTLYYDTYILQITIGRETYGGRLKFLTFWNLVLQWLFFGFSIINDLFGSNLSPGVTEANQRTLLQRIRDLVAVSIIFPIGTFVVITFWSIYAVDREMIFPKELDKLIPCWLNHAWHSTVIVYLLIEKFLVYHHYPSRTFGMACCVAFGSTYQIWIFWIAYAAAIWVYPILAVFNWPLRFAFIAVCWVLLAMTYCVGEFVTHLFWKDCTLTGRDQSTKKKPTKNIN